MDVNAFAVRGIAGVLTTGEAFRFAVTHGATWAALHPEGRWLLSSLRLDEEQRHNPSGVFAAVHTQEVVSVSAHNFGSPLFRELLNFPFDRLAKLQLVDCLFEHTGTEAVAHLMAKSPIRHLDLTRCFLEVPHLEQLAHAAGSSTLTYFHLTESGFDVPLGPALRTLLSECRLQELSLCGRFGIGVELASALGRSAGLSCLKLLDNPLLHNADICGLCDSPRPAAGHVGIKRLDLSAQSGGALTDVAGRAIAAALMAGADMTELRLVGHKMTKAALAAILQAGSQLQFVDFRANHLGDPTADPDLAAAVAGATELRSLCVGGGSGAFYDYGSDDEGCAGPDQRLLRTLAWAAAALPRLEYFEASNAALEDDALEALASEVKRIAPSAAFRPAAAGAPRLLNLDLSSNFITEDGTVAMLDALKVSGVQLKRLNLGANELGDVGCQAIAAALRRGGALDALPDTPLSALVYLSLRRNRIGNADGICSVLPRATLRELDLRENHVGDSHVRRLLNVRRGPLPILLRLAGNGIPEEMAAAAADREFNFMLGSDLATTTAQDNEGLPHLAKDGCRRPPAASADAEAVVAAAPAPWMRPNDDPLGELASLVGGRRDDLLRPGQCPAEFLCETGDEVPLPERPTEADSSFVGAAGEACNGNSSIALAQDMVSTSSEDIVRQHGRASDWSGLGGASLFEDEEGEVHLAVSRAEWQDCLDTLKFMESCIIK